jgi:NADH-quinone oxidoreductase subunit N
VQHISQTTGKETIDDYRGLARANPALAWLLAIALFSLAGIPPTAGFFGKFFLLLAGAGKGTWFLIIVAALNMIVSLYYYLRVVKAMFMETQASPIERIPLPLSAKIALAVCVAGIFITGLFGGAYEYIFSLMRQ